MDDDQTPQQVTEQVTSSEEKKKKEGEEGIRKKRKGNNGAKDEEGAGAGDGDELDNCDQMSMHMLLERQRRRKMKDMFTDLHILLSGPHPAKTDKSTIIDETVSRIKYLEEEIKIKEKQKEERLPQKINRSAKISREAFLANQVAASTPSTGIDVGAVTGTNSSSSSSFYDPVMFETWNSMNVVLSICGNEAQYFVCSSKKQGLMTSMVCVFEKYGVDVISARLSTHGNKRTYTIQACVMGISDQVGNSLQEIFKQVARELSFVVCYE